MFRFALHLFTQLPDHRERICPESCRNSGLDKLEYDQISSNSVLITYMVLLQELSELLQAEDPEERQTITGVNWESYEALGDF